MRPRATWSSFRNTEKTVGISISSSGRGRRKGGRNFSGIEDLLSWLVNISCINNGLDEARPRNSDPNCCANLHCSSAKNNKLWWRTWFLGWPMNLYCTSPFLPPYSRNGRILLISDSILVLYLSDRNCMIVSVKPGSMVLW